MGARTTLARCLANMPDKQAAALITVESLGQRTSYTSKGLWTRGCPLKHVKEQTTGRSGRTRKSSNCRERLRHNRFSRRGARIVG